MLQSIKILKVVEILINSMHKGEILKNMETVLAKILIQQFMNQHNFIKILTSCQILIKDNHNHIINNHNLIFQQKILSKNIKN